jgi:hypothetical protein
MLCEDALYEMWLGVFELVVASDLEFMSMHHRVNFLNFLVNEHGRIL